MGDRWDECRELLRTGQFRAAAPLADDLVAGAHGDAALLDALDLQARSRAGSGRYEDAIESLERRVEVASRIDDPAAHAMALVRLGRLYLRMQRNELALEALTRVFALTPTPEAKVALQSALADAYTQIGHYDRAEYFCDEAVIALQEIYGDAAPLLQADAQRLMAERRLALARLASAQYQYRRALYTLESIDVAAEFGTGSYLADPAEVPVIRQHAAGLEPAVALERGRAHLGSGEPHVAREHFERARSSAAANGDIALEVLATAAAGRADLMADRPESAAAELRQALDLADRWLTHLDVEEFRTGLRTALAETHADLALAALLTEDPELAWEAAERARGREFLASLHSAGSPPGLDGPAADVEAMARQIESVTARLRDLPAGSPAFGRLRDERTALLDEKDRRLQALYRLAPRRVPLVHNAIPAPAEIAEVLGDDTALVEYFCMADDVLAITVTDGGMTLQSLNVHPAALARRIGNFRRLVETRPGVSDSSWRGPARELHGRLWAPVLPHVGDKARVAVVPHGPLANVPFPALEDDGLLLETTEIVVVPSAGILAAIARDPARVRQRAAVFANPLRDGPWHLPATEAEAEAIERTPLEVDVYRGDAATPAAFLAAAGSTDVVHAACHADFDADRPLLSALLLSSHDGEPQRLEAHTIYGLELAAGLVVLSACETGRTEQEAAGELEGLVRAFMIAGAATVVGSLWVVADPAAARLMAAFYESLAGGAGPGAALRTAQLGMVRDPRFDHPYYWAAHTAWGDWR